MLQKRNLEDRHPLCLPNAASESQAKHNKKFSARYEYFHINCWSGSSQKSPKQSRLMPLFSLPTITSSASKDKTHLVTKCREIRLEWNFFPVS